MYIYLYQKQYTTFLVYRPSYQTIIISPFFREWEQSSLSRSPHYISVDELYKSETVAIASWSVLVDNTMDRVVATPTSSTTQKLKLQKRPDSMKLELLTIPENGCVQTFPTSPGTGSIGFKDLSYSVREGLIRRREWLYVQLVLIKCS